MRCELTDDPGELLAVAGQFLASRPVEHNLLLTLAERARSSEVPSRWGWVSDGDDVVGVEGQVPATYRAALSPMPAEAAVVLAERLAREVPDLPGIEAEAATAARFAGAWVTVRRVAARPIDGRRLYRLGRLVEPPGGPGRLRQAVTDDVGLLNEWRAAFDWEAGGDPPPGYARPHLRQRIEAGEAWLWEVDGQPVSGAFATPPAAGASRIGFVYTPPPQRRRGYAAACVGALSAHLLAGGIEHVLLFTHLANPTSNALYQRLGYEPLSEILLYRFAP